MLALLMAIRAQGGFVTERGASLLDGPHWSRSYLCADGGHVAVQALEPKFYALLLAGLGLAADPVFVAGHFDRRAWPVLTARMAGIFAGQPRAHWETVFAGSDACVAPILSPDEAARDPHLAARGVWLADPLQPAPAPRFDRARRQPGTIPLRGQHCAELRAELATSDEKPQLS